ncbi:hypothetical protein GCM10027067_26480 [Pseudactinotalea suaedae]
MAAFLTVLGLLVLGAGVLMLAGPGWALVYGGIVLTAGGVLTHLGTTPAPAPPEQETP